MNTTGYGPDARINIYEPASWGSDSWQQIAFGHEAIHGTPDETAGLRSQGIYFNALGLPEYARWHQNGWDGAAKELLDEN